MSDVEEKNVKASNWNQLSYFKVFVHNDSHLQNPRYPLLNNGNQQVLVTVRLAAQDALGNFVTIPQADLNKIRLIDYGTSQEIYYGSELQSWSTSSTNLGYTWDRSFLDSLRSLRLEQPKLFEQVDDEQCAVEHDHMDVPHKAIEQAQEWPPVLMPLTQEELANQAANDYQSVQFYLRTTSTISRRIAARVSNSDGTVFRTNYSEVGDDNGEGDKRGKFNSSFEIEPLTFPRLPSENYGDRLANGYLKDTPIGNGSFAGGNYRSFEHHVNIKMPNGRAVPIKSIPNFNGLDSPVWGSRGGGSSKCTMTYMALPGSSYINYPQRHYIAINRSGVGVLNTGVWLTYLSRGLGLENKIKYPRSGEVVIGQAISTDSFLFYSTVNMAKELPSQTTYDFSVIDVYGTTHNLRVGLIPAFNYLTLEKR